MQSGQVLIVSSGPDGELREAEIVKVLGSNGGPPFLVRWRDTGQLVMFVPDEDAWVDSRETTPTLPFDRCG